MMLLQKKSKKSSKQPSREIISDDNPDSDSDNEIMAGNTSKADSPSKSSKKLEAAAAADLEELELPPSDVLFILIDRIESQLPKDDVVKFDSRAKKLNWKKISEEMATSVTPQMQMATSPTAVPLDADGCHKIWNYIQVRGKIH